MKKNVSLLFTTVSLCFICLLATTVSRAQMVDHNKLVMGIVDSVHSKILNETRKIWVYVPPGANSNTFAKLHYPVLYLLDGDQHFSSVMGMVQQLGEINGNQVCPDMIIVGILTPNRSRDLTPTNAPPDKTSGGGEKFTDFIKTELMPHIDSIYPTAPYKILIGHSYGGLMVMNTLINHPEMFNAYVAIDPSMWWDNRKLLNHASEVLKQKSYAGKWLYMGIANTMHPGMDTLQVRKDTSQFTKHIRAILILKDMLQSDEKTDGLKFAYKYYKDDSHLTVPLITEYDALHFLFSYYALSDDMLLKLKVYNKTRDTAWRRQIEAHYEYISKQMGYRQYPPERLFNGIGHVLLTTNPDAAFMLFSMNVQNYPDSYNSYDSMGDYYASVKNNAKAIDYYKKALAIKEIKTGRDKLNKLLDQK
jgi:predicted alpha/beta superfamily hydrolase